MTQGKKNVDVLEQIKEVAGEHAEAAGEKLSDAADEVKNFVKKHPLASVAIAAGVGYLIGRLLSKDRS